jgi:hypothetical protein
MAAESNSRSDVDNRDEIQLIDEVDQVVQLKVCKIVDQDDDYIGNVLGPLEKRRPKISDGDSEYEALFDESEGEDGIDGPSSDLKPVAYRYAWFTRQDGKKSNAYFKTFELYDMHGDDDCLTLATFNMIGNVIFMGVKENDGYKEVEMSVAPRLTHTVECHKDVQAFSKRMALWAERCPDDYLKLGAQFEKNVVKTDKKTNEFYLKMKKSKSDYSSKADTVDVVAFDGKTPLGLDAIEKNDLVEVRFTVQAWRRENNGELGAGLKCRPITIRRIMPPGYVAKPGPAAVVCGVTSDGQKTKPLQESPNKKQKRFV